MRPQVPLQRPVQPSPSIRASYSQRPHPAPAPYHPPTSDYYQDDAYAAMIPADVTQEWEDDAAGMRYGDWEADEQEVQMYVQPRAELVSRATRKLPAIPGPGARGYGTHHSRDVQVASSEFPSPQAFPQEARPYQRTTQPLNPRLTVHMNQNLPPETPRTARPTRQLVAEGQMMPAPLVSAARPTGGCLICKGAGYVRADVAYGHPNFGKPIACVCKEAECKEKRRQQLRSISNLDAFKDKTFKTFNHNVSPSVKRAYDTALEYANEPDGWLILIGKNGCGKTHLAAAVANEYLAGGSLVLFSTVSDLLDHLRATFSPNSTEVYDQLFAKMREAELLVLDDLGAQQSSPWANEKLFQLLNYRYNSRFPTVITTNNIGLQAIDERIRSRLTDASLVVTAMFDGAPDYRPRNPRHGEQG